MYEVAAALFVHAQQRKRPADPVKAEDAFYAGYGRDPLSAVSRLIRRVAGGITSRRSREPSRRQHARRRSA